MAIAVYTGATQDALLDFVRKECRDPALNRSALAIPAAQLKFTDDEGLTAIRNALVQLGVEMSGYDPNEALNYVDASYGADAISSVLPAGVPAAAPIVKVEDLTDSSRPQRIPYISAREIEDYSASNTTAFIPYPAYRYTLAASGTDKVLIVRPRPRGGALLLRIWYIAPPTVTGAGADVHPLTLFWGELVGLLAATKLMRRFGGAEQEQLAQLADLMVQFRSFSARQRGTQRVRRVRRGVS